ncbi:MAG: flagellar filament capping protein FliD [Planctomycetaceae bacterium]|nr:flagellar filament capping protein FliD [Planctomycetaceae bacterium]
MTGIRSTTGLVSGVDIGALVTAIIGAERAPAARLEARAKNLQATQAGLGQIQAQLLSLSSSVLTLSNRATFSSLGVVNSDPTQLAVTAKTTAAPGTYQFQAVRLATSHRVASKGVSDPSAALGLTGQISIRRGGDLSRPVKLDLLNNGQGVRLGQIKITDRSGAAATVDLRNSVNSAEVVEAINNAGIGVTASVRDGQFILRDTTGQSGNLTVAEIGSGKTATDLGLAQSVNASTLTGNTVLRVTNDFTLGLLNDGNGLKQTTGESDLRIHLASGADVDVNLDDAKTIGDVLTKLNAAGQTGNTFTAALVDDRIVITDNTTGSDTLSVSNLNGSNATEVFGLENSASGNTLTGTRLISGLNSVLLKNLRGGEGIQQLGSINLTDRTGATATVDLSSAESLDEVLDAINTATTSGGAPLTLKAELSGNGTGIVVRDTSASTASNLIIADVGGGTTAADLGLTIDAAANETNGAALGFRQVNEATSLNNYSPQGLRVASGSFQIKDSAGLVKVVNITSAVKTIGDVIDRINTSGSAVTAKLNSTGDGIELVDNAGGTGTFSITDLGGKAASDLRLTTTAVTGTDGKQRINARQALTVDVVETDSLGSIGAKISLLGGTVRASVSSTGAALNGYRLSIQSTTSGDASRFQVDDGGLNLGFNAVDVGRDAVLRIGGVDSAATVVTSSSNTFTDAVSGIDVTALKVGTSPATITTSPDTNKVQTALQSFVNSYNTYIDTTKTLTKFDVITQQRAALQGSNTPLNIQQKLNTLFNRVTGAEGTPIRSLADVGIRLTAGGKLSFDTDKLNAALRDHPTEVRNMFSDTTTGFGKAFSTALDQLNNEQTGTLTAEVNGVQKTIESLQQRVVEFDDRLVVRKTRLEQRFANMETILSGLQSQQGTLTTLTSVLANMRATTSS